MKVKILTSYPKKTIEVENVYFSSDIHYDHEAVIKFGRNFFDLKHMNSYMVKTINDRVGEKDLLVLLGDTMMGEKDYSSFLSSLTCKNVILLYGNHCSISKLQATETLYQGYYLELSIDKQIICCSHYPMFNWNYQDEGSFQLHGHTHGDESPVLKEIHKYKSMDVGVDSYYNIFGEYNVFSFEQIKKILRNKLTIGRHG